MDREPYNNYTHRPEYVRTSRSRNGGAVMLFLLGMVLGGAIGFAIGLSWPTSGHTQSAQRQVVIEHRVVYDHKTVADKPSVACKPIYDMSGDYKPYVVIQCSNGTMKVIRG